LWANAWQGCGQDGYQGLCAPPPVKRQTVCLGLIKEAIDQCLAQCCAYEWLCLCLYAARCIWWCLTYVVRRGSTLQLRLLGVRRLKTAEPILQVTWRPACCSQQRVVPMAWGCQPQHECVSVTPGKREDGLLVKQYACRWWPKHQDVHSHWHVAPTRGVCCCTGSKPSDSGLGVRQGKPLMLPADWSRVPMLTGVLGCGCGCASLEVSGIRRGWYQVAVVRLGLAPKCQLLTARLFAQGPCRVRALERDRLSVHRWQADQYTACNHASVLPCS
jgi:hypothetical protein